MDGADEIISTFATRAFEAVPEFVWSIVGVGVVLVLFLALVRRTGILNRWHKPVAHVEEAPSAAVSSEPPPRRRPIPKDASAVLDLYINGDISQEQLPEVLRLLELVQASRQSAAPSDPTEPESPNLAEVETKAAKLASGPTAMRIAEQLFRNAVGSSAGPIDEKIKDAFVRTVQDILVSPRKDELPALQLLASGRSEEAFKVLGSQAGRPDEARLRTLAALQAPSDVEGAARVNAQAVTAASQRAILNSGLVARYAIRDVPGVEVGIITGDIADVRDIDVWVSSENHWLLMARMVDRSISASIRYLSARKTDDGLPLNDPQQRALRRSAYGRIRPHELGATLMTRPGELEETHGVKRIVHVVSVEARPLKPVLPGPHPDIYVESAISLVDSYNRGWFRSSKAKLRSMVIPPFGTGQGTVEPRLVSDQLVEGLLDALRGRKAKSKTELTRIYFLAFTTRELNPLRESFEKRVQIGELTSVS